MVLAERARVLRSSSSFVSTTTERSRQRRGVASKRHPATFAGAETTTKTTTTTTTRRSKNAKFLMPKEHERTKKWVAFSDLHASRKTKDVCLETLKHVHDVAQREDRGILFLGDFWHHRGALPVDTLNEIMAALSRWTQPTIMLVGNHDQVNVQGSVHALEVLRMCNPEKIVVFDEPRVWKGAMSVSYTHLTLPTICSV